MYILILSFRDTFLLSFHESMYLCILLVFSVIWSLLVTMFIGQKYSDGYIKTSSTC